MTKSASFFLFCLLVQGCIEEFQVDVDRSGGQLVVYGSIIDRPGPYELRLGRVEDETGMPEPLDGALVRIVDRDGNSESYTQTGPGSYRLTGNIVRGARGQSYHVEIRLTDGSRYASLPEPIPVAAAQDSVWLEIGTVGGQSASGRIFERPSVLVYLDSELPAHEDPVYLKWHVESTYSFVERAGTHPLAPPPQTCYITRRVDPQKISLFSTQASGAPSIGGHLLATEPVRSHEFYRRHYFNVIQFSVTGRRFRYWERVEGVINRTGTIFDAPPATVSGNMFNVDDPGEQVLGYFETAAVDTSRAFLTRSDFSFSVLNPCGPHFACRNCLLLENSSLERPWYFGEQTGFSHSTGSN